MNDRLIQSIMSDNVDEFQRLVAAGADINYTGYNYPPLGWAIMASDSIFRELIQMPGININAHSNGYTALHVAIESNKLDKFETLMSMDGINVNGIVYAAAYPPLLYAVQNRDPTMLRALLSHPDIDVNVHKNGRTALITAVDSNLAEKVRILLAVDGINVNAIAYDGNTALDIAEQNDNDAIAEMLREAGAVRAQEINNRYNNNIINNGNNNNYSQLNGLFKNSLPTNAVNAITMDPITEGQSMVNFHGEFEKGRYYTRDTYNSLSRPKRNPFTRRNIMPANVIAYKARVTGGKRRKSIATRRRKQK